MIAATAVGDNQVSYDEFRPWRKTRLFPDNVTFIELTAWAKLMMHKDADWEDLLLSKVDEPTTEQQKGQP